MRLKSRYAYETHAFQVELYLNGPIVDPLENPNFPQEKILYISADVNFDGFISSNERHEIEVSNPSFASAWFLADDDGPWPGNGVPVDQITVNASFVTDTDSASIDIHNLPPVILSAPTISYYQNEFGKTIARTSVSFVEASHRDQHELKVEWNDGVVTSTNSMQAHETCSGHFSGFVEREVPEGFKLTARIVEVIDDDNGTDQRTMSQIDVEINNDDDNQNQREDLFDRGFSDDDLKQFNLLYLKAPGMNPSTGTLSLHYNPSEIRLWTTQDKGALILPGGASAPNFLGIPTVPYTGQNTVWVEGISPGESDVYFSWTPNDPHSGGCWDGSLEGSHLTVRVWGIDLDIDSDNNGTIDHSDLEEEIESNEYAIGKLLVDNNDPNAQLPIPISIRLPTGLAPTQTLRLDGRVAEGAATGKIDLFNSKNEFLGNSNFNGLIGTFTLQQLRYDAGTGEIIVFAKVPFANGIAATKKIVDQFGKPDNRIVASIELQEHLVKDEVKVMLVRDYFQAKLISDFYIHVNASSWLRSAGAAKAVYQDTNGNDLGKNFALKRLNRSEVEEIIDNDAMSTVAMEDRGVVRATILSYLFDHRPRPFPERPLGFQAALYRDYVSGGYRLALRGTEMGEWDGMFDWIDNIRQALLGDSRQYDAAILLAWATNKLDTVRGRGFELTGHSLGGGLASAAAIANEIHADVFNGAGVHRNSLFQNNGIDPIIPGTNPSLANAEQWITHRYVGVGTDPHLNRDDCPDILTWVSWQVALMPDPNGNLLPLEGLYNLNNKAAHENLKAFLADLPGGLNDLLALKTDEVFLAQALLVLAAARSDINKMIGSHDMDNIFFGLLHNDDTLWNAFDDENPRSR
jgi:hypothetical protein